jgi:hypothetical protein
LIQINICGAVRSGRSTFYRTAIEVLSTTTEPIVATTYSACPPSPTSFSTRITDITTKIDSQTHRLRFADIEGGFRECVPHSTATKIHAFLITFDAHSKQSFEDALVIYTLCHEFCESQHKTLPVCPTLIALVENVHADSPRTCKLLLDQNTERFKDAIYKRADVSSVSDVRRILNDILKIVGEQIHLRRVEYTAADSDSVLVIGIARYLFRVRPYDKNSSVYKQYSDCRDQSDQVTLSSYSAVQAMNECG